MYIYTYMYIYLHMYINICMYTNTRINFSEAFIVRVYPKQLFKKFRVKFE